MCASADNKTNEERKKRKERKMEEACMKKHLLSISSLFQ
jgi:hypothetical protein